MSAVQASAPFTRSEIVAIVREALGEAEKSKGYQGGMALRIPRGVYSLRLRFLFEGREYLHDLLLPLPGDMVALANDQHRNPHGALDLLLELDTRKPTKRARPAAGAAKTRGTK